MDKVYENRGIKMEVTINVSSEEAENILFSLAIRSKQTKLSPQRAQETVALGKKLNTTFEKAFDWTPWDRLENMTEPIKRVTITTYDYPPMKTKEIL